MKQSRLRKQSAGGPEPGRFLVHPLLIYGKWALQGCDSVRPRQRTDTRGFSPPLRRLGFPHEMWLYLQ